MELRPGHVAVVTGAASGIGLAVARGCGARGLQLVIADINVDGLNAAVEEISKKGTRVISCICDVTKKAEIQKLHDIAYQTFGVVHLMFNNAGAMGPRCNIVTELSDQELEWILDLNQNSVLHGLRIFGKAMHQGGEEGCIVSTASIYGLSPAVGAYGITKHAVVAMTEAFQQSLAALNSKVFCAVICPSFYNTNIAEATYPQNASNNAEELARAPPERRLALEMTALLTSEHGESLENFATCMFAGIAAGQHYIHTHDEVSFAFVQDRLEGLTGQRKVQNTHTLQMADRLVRLVMKKKNVVAVDKVERSKM